MMHKVLFCLPGSEPELREVEGSIIAKIGELIGPTKAVEGVSIPGGFVLYHDADAIKKKFPLNRTILGTPVHGKFFIAKLDIHSNPPVVGLKDVEVEALKALITPSRKFKKPIKNYDIN